jgi:hypothetical protein
MQASSLSFGHGTKFLVAPIHCFPLWLGLFLVRYHLRRQAVSLLLGGIIGFLLDSSPTPLLLTNAMFSLSGLPVVSMCTQPPTHAHAPVQIKPFVFPTARNNVWQGCRLFLALK